MSVAQYDVAWSDSSLMWEVFDVDNGGTIAWFEYGADADSHAMDLNVLERFEADMAAYHGCDV